MGADVMSTGLLAQARASERDRLDLSVFHQGWWRDIARGFPGYREVKALSGTDVVGRLSFVLRRNRLGMTSGQDPYWAHLGGPIVEESLSADEKARAVRKLLGQLPRRTSFTFVCDSTLSYADIVRSAFFEAGFEHSSQITYVRHPNAGSVLNARSRKHRGHFKRAAKCLSCVDLTSREFVAYFGANLKAMGKYSYAPLNMLTPLIQQAVDCGCGRIIAARQSPPGICNEDQTVMPYDAAIVYIWDDRRCYYWLSTHRAASDADEKCKPHPDAVKLLLVTAMEHAQSLNLVFDADGVVTPGADHLYRNILGLRIEERRDVFRRVSSVERIYQRSRFKLIRWRSGTSALSTT